MQTPTKETSRPALMGAVTNLWQRWVHGRQAACRDVAASSDHREPALPEGSSSRAEDEKPPTRAGKWPAPAILPPHIGCCAIILAVFLSLLADTAHAQSPDVHAQSPAAQRGLTFVRANCARCHSVDRVSDSPLKIAPAFRTLHRKYPVENLAEAFAEGISTGHPTMPEFQLDPGQIGDLLAFLKTLER